MHSLRLFFAITFLLVSDLLHAEFIFAGREARLCVSDPSAQLILYSPLKSFTGTLQRGDDASDHIKGPASIFFNGGAIESLLLRASFSGALSSNNNDLIALAGGHQLAVSSGVVTAPIFVSGAGNVIQGAPLFGQQIVLTDSSSHVMMAIVSPLNQAIVLNGGSVSLGLDLDFVQSGALVGSGTLHGNGYALRLNERIKTWDGALTFCHVGRVELRGTTLLSSQWTFSSGTRQSCIDGGNHILDLSLGGSLVIAPGNELVIVNTTLRGIGGGKGAFVFGDAHARVALVGCTIELDGDYTVSSGIVACRGEDSLVKVGPYRLQFDQNGLLVLDGAHLVCDTLGSATPGAIRVDDVHVQAFNNARILARIDEAGIPPLVFTRAENVLGASEDLNVNRILSFNVPGVEAITLDGRGLTLRMPQSRGAVIVIPEGQTVTLQNIVVDGLYPEHIALGEGSSLIFGDNTYVCLGGDSVLTYPFMFQGSSVLCGAGSVLTLGKTGSVVVKASSTLNVADVVIKGISTAGGQITLQDQSSTLACVGAALQCDSNYAITMGTLLFYGSSSTIITGQNVFSFAKNGCLIVDGVSLFYDTLASPDLRNIQPWQPDGVLFVSKNGGRICPMSSLEKECDIILDMRVNTLTQSEALSPARRLVFRGQRAFGSSLTLDGAGFVMQLPRARPDMIVVPDGKSVTLQNVILRDFSPAHVKLGVGASLTFGDGVLIQMADDCVLTDSLSFAGNVMLDGRYKTIDFNSPSNPSFILATGGVLKIINTTLLGLSGEPLRALSPDAAIQFYSSTLQLDDDVVFGEGSLDIYNDVWLMGAQKTFSFTSRGVLRVHHGAQFYVDTQSVLAYDSPLPTNIAFDDATAKIFLQDATFRSGDAGLDLQKGTILVGGISVLDGSTTGTMTIGVDMTVTVQNGAMLDLKGTVLHQ